MDTRIVKRRLKTASISKQLSSWKPEITKMQFLHLRQLEITRMPY